MKFSPTRGRIERPEAAEGGIGFVFQEPTLMPWATAFDNVWLPFRLQGRSRAEVQDRVMAALDMVGLASFSHAYPRELSGGMRMRVSIARALVNRPEIVWADEPTGALDSQTADDVMDLIEELNIEQELTVVIVTHDPRVAARCHRIIRMRDGVIVKEEAGK